MYSLLHAASFFSRFFILLQWLLLDGLIYMPYLNKVLYCVYQGIVSWSSSMFLLSDLCPHLQTDSDGPQFETESCLSDGDAKGRT